jgi:excisionase family DNA binding protein
MKYITSKQAAEILGLKDYHTVIKYIKAGWLKGKKFGNQWMLTKKDVLERKLRREQELTR